MVLNIELVVLVTARVWGIITATEAVLLIADLHVTVCAVKIVQQVLMQFMRACSSLCFPHSLLPYPRYPPPHFKCPFLSLCRLASTPLFSLPPPSSPSTLTSSSSCAAASLLLTRCASSPRCLTLTWRSGMR